MLFLTPDLALQRPRHKILLYSTNWRRFSYSTSRYWSGLSRKSTIWKTLKIRAEDALNGTTVLNTAALLKGASILRVHDVREAVEAIKLTNS